MWTMLLWIPIATALPSATHDDNVEWAGVSHIPWLMRSPLCPVDGEAFTIQFQTWHYDITSARVRTWDGSEQWLDATWSHTDGPYDVWVCTIPSTASDSIRYYIELTDGADTDYYGTAGMRDDPPPSSEEFVVDFATLSHAPLGATLTSDGGAVFRIWAPGASSANVCGEFNGWNTSANPMTTDGNYWVARIANVGNHDMYKYFFNGSIWKPDARARALNPSEYYNSHVEDPAAYTWGDTGWQTPDFEDFIIYELHVGSFCGRNDGVSHSPATYRDVVDVHLDHLIDLGVTAVQIMPIGEFPGDFSWGYNPVSEWAPEWKYGSPDDLKYMIDKLHQAGIAVLLDVVYNHFSIDENYLWYYDGTQIYFDSPAVDTPWGSQADFDRWEVRDYYADNILYWLWEFHLDGFRMDATDYMDMYQPSGWSLMQRINDEIDNVRARALSIAEQLPNDTWITKPTSEGGAGFDTQTHDAFTDTIRQEIADAAYGDPEMWKIRDAIDDANYPNKTNLVRYVEGHDEAGHEARLPKLIDPTNPGSYWAKGRTKLAEGLTILVPGIPLFLQGAEFLEDDYFGDSGDGRIDWNHKIWFANIFDYFCDLIRVRKTNGCFRSNAGYQIYHVNESGNVIAFQRWDASGCVCVVVANFSNNDYPSYELGFPYGGQWSEILNSMASEYDGNGMTNGTIWAGNTPRDGFDYSASIVLPQMGLLVFRLGADLVGDFDEDGDVDDDDWATFQGCFSGPNNTRPPGCRPCDLDGDDDVDLIDYATFQTNYTG